MTTALGDSRQRDDRSLPLHEWTAFDDPAQNLATLFMIGMAAVLSLCERAATDPGGRSPYMIAERLRRIAGSGSERAHGFIKQLGARRLAGTEAERLFPMFPALCARAGLMPQPEIYLYKGSALNAFALGDSASSIILISEGLLARLDAKEMTAVLAHEIGHILNGDARVLALAAELNQMIINAVIAIILQEVGGGTRARRGPPTHPLAILLLVVAAPFVGSLLQHGLSRTREYDADRLAAGLMGQPFWLVGALRTLSAETAKAGYAPTSLSSGVGALMRSHPDVDERIDRLAMLVHARR